jgi:hypothetical protein
MKAEGAVLIPRSSFLITSLFVLHSSFFGLLCVSVPLWFNRFVSLLLLGA